VEGRWVQTKIGVGCEKGRRQHFKERFSRKINKRDADEASVVRYYGDVSCESVWDSCAGGVVDDGDGG
jgi:hypothetical protein